MTVAGTLAVVTFSGVISVGLLTALGWAMVTFVIPTGACP